ncbi:hypothetical protein [Agrobacterium sp. LAD9]|uniref:hypothetical protein n=1 Tax=Agrobacterium sp. LAD9 TaxID=2055153 RepID=UPI0012900E50|nr:hypothetical protein [Agrobacterium sp. LAD9]
MSAKRRWQAKICFARNDLSQGKFVLGGAAGFHHDLDQYADFECAIDVRRETVRSLTNRLGNAMFNRNHLDEQTTCHRLDYQL